MNFVNDAEDSGGTGRAYLDPMIDLNVGVGGVKMQSLAPKLVFHLMTTW